MNGVYMCVPSASSNKRIEQKLIQTRCIFVSSVSHTRYLNTYTQPFTHTHTRARTYRHILEYIPSNRENGAPCRHIYMDICSAQIECHHTYGQANIVYRNTHATHRDTFYTSIEHANIQHISYSILCFCFIFRTVIELMCCCVAVACLPILYDTPAIFYTCRAVQATC